MTRLVGDMVRRAAALAAERGYAAGGFRTVFNCNADAGQTVFHLHLHVLGGRTPRLAPGLTNRHIQEDFTASWLESYRDASVNSRSGSSTSERITETSSSMAGT